MSEWRPIETAPRDEDAYILLYRNGAYDVGRYFGYEDEDGRPVWFNEDVVIKPTHWMPLPEPPK